MKNFFKKMKKFIKNLGRKGEKKVKISSRRCESVGQSGFYLTKPRVLYIMFKSRTIENKRFATEEFIMAKEVMLTKEGKEELEKRLEYLKVEKSAEITERIKTAREFGDLSENAEYDAAKNEQAMVAGEIFEIEEKLKYAVIIDDAAAKKGMVSLGSKVDFEDADTGESFTYEIVGTTEADVEQGRISNESPIGSALLQHKAGDKVRIVVPSGILNVIVKKVY